MQTRFEAGIWLRVGGEAILPDEMMCSHIMNIVRMCIIHPSKILGMCVNDLEDTRMGNYDTHEYCVKVNYFTSMSEEQLIDYFLRSNLFHLMQVQMQKNGVDVKNYVCLCYSERGNKE